MFIKIGFDLNSKIIDQYIEKINFKFVLHTISS